jgi:type II secretory pathway predicted ATPase ExeA
MNKKESNTKEKLPIAQETSKVVESQPDEQFKIDDVIPPAVDPFSKRIGAQEVFLHQQIRELQEIVRTAIAQRSIALIIGPPGVGKTTGVRSVTDELPVNKYTVVYLGQDQNGGNLLSRFSEALGLPIKGFRARLVLKLSQWLLDNLKDGGKDIILVVDEAHLLDDQTLEDLRLLSNADYDRQSPFTLLMIAQPWLRARLKSPFFEPLNQRIRYRYSLEGMSKEDAFSYLRCRLSAAGVSELFTDEALVQIFSYCEGIPRKIHNLCSLLLLKARVAELNEIDVALVRQIADSLDI